MQPVSILLSINKRALEAGESASVSITHRDKSAPQRQESLPVSMLLNRGKRAESASLYCKLRNRDNSVPDAGDSVSLFITQQG